jgi:hypothetical protein
VGTETRAAKETRYPKPLIEKLGITPLAVVSIVGVDDRFFLDQLRSKTTSISNRARKGSDAIFFAANSKRDLARLPKLKGYLKPEGAIWIIRPKGEGTRLKEADLFPSVKAAGLVDVKVVSFSETHSALKVVIPVAAR